MSLPFSNVAGRFKITVAYDSTVEDEGRREEEVERCKLSEACKSGVKPSRVGEGL